LRRIKSWALGGWGKESWSVSRSVAKQSKAKEKLNSTVSATLWRSEQTGAQHL